MSKTYSLTDARRPYLTTDAVKRVEIYNKVNEFWNEHMIQYPIATKPVAFAARKNLAGLTPHPFISGAVRLFCMLKPLHHVL